MALEKDYIGTQVKFLSLNTNNSRFGIMTFGQIFRWSFQQCTLLYEFLNGPKFTFFENCLHRQSWLTRRNSYGVVGVDVFANAYILTMVTHHPHKEE